VEINVENPVYMIYTSGSTGRPKGVVISHRAICNHLHWMQSRFTLTAVDRVLQQTAISFDPSVWELFAPLVTGARLIVAQPEGHRDPGYLVETIRREQVTVLQLVPSLLRQLLAEPGFASCESLKWICCGGEEMPAELVRKFKEQHTCELVNLYGPTEAAIDSVYGVCSGEEEPVAIGRPIANATVYVLDEWQKPVPIGVPGELYVGGAGLGRGYHQQAALTAERFVPDPFSAEGGARLYRTGDLVRWRADGRLVFCGRVDEQVKVRGHRIELGEIETVLQQHAAVQEAVVVVREDVAEQRELVGYVVGQEEMSVSSSELRQYLKERLPDYMVPSWLVWLDELPLSPSGKVARRALPAPERVGSEQGAEESRTPIEEIVAGVWSELLHVSQLRVADNFFELGGHSLLATQLVSRLRTAFSVELPLRLLFDAPTVAGQARAIEEALKGDAGVTAPPLHSLADQDHLPLSFAQQRLWFLDQLEPGRSTYNMPTEIRLTGKLNVAALERSLSEVVRRHDVLRTTFLAVNGEPVQVVAPAHPVRLSILDLSEMGEEERQLETERHAVEEARRPFDLRQGPVWRAQLVRLGAAEHVLLFTMHHIVSDGWSMEILTREVSALYEAYAMGQESPLEELPIQYADYAVWQREWLQGEMLEEQLEYWRKQLAGAPAMLELPTDRPRPAQLSHRGAYMPLQLPSELTSELKQLSQREGVTLFMSLLAGWQLLLARYSRQQDVVVGSPVANRTLAEVEGLIGFFVNTLVLRTEVAGELHVSELLQRVREVCLGAYAHQEVPFEMLVEQLHPERQLSHTPLFQVMFTLQTTATPAAAVANQSPASPREARSETAKFDLTLVMSEAQGVLNGQVEYNTDLYEQATISRMVAHFGQLLSELVAAPEKQLWELSLLTEAERAQLLTEWNQTAREYPREAGLAELFERQVQQTPEAVAVVYGGKQLSYGELNRQANQLGHYLQSLGVGNETLVGICMERSLPMIVSLLGILKAGGAYLPLDADYPQSRLRLMLENAQPLVVLTDEAQLAKCAELPAPALCLEREWEQVAECSTENLMNASSGDNLAYVIYTSGSSGQPKGVAVPQRAVSRLVLNTNYIQIEAGDGIAQASNSSFDAATFEIWGALLHGARLVGLSKEVVLSGQLAAQLEEHGINVLFLTTALFNQIAREEPQTFGGLKYVMFGGEAADVKWVRAVLEAGAPSNLLNGYGPTENATFSTTYRVEQVTETATTIPIGRPVANTQTYVLDERQQVVPVGIAGELFVGGEGLAREYLHSPVLTAARFVPDPFSGVAGARLYRTGDLVRWRADGEMEFLGRVDEQVKLRGFRIELGEIESVLCEHAGVQEAVVVMREDVAGQRELVGYLVGHGGVTVTSSELRQYLKERLPDYMVPSWLVWLAELPLTANGKLDRRALPAPDRQGFSETTLISPRNTLELKLLQCWEQVLGFGPISVKDNFFELGGHSLLAARMVAMAEKSLGRDIPLALLFQSPTVESLARTLQQQSEPASWQTLVELQPGESRQPLFLVHPVGGNVLCYAHLVRHLGPSQAVYAFQAQGLDGETAPHEQIETMATQYLEAMLEVQPEGPYFLGGWSMGGTVAFEMAQQLRLRGEQVAMLVLLDSYVPVSRARDSQDDLMLLKSFALDLGLTLDRLNVPLDNLRTMGQDELLACLLEHATAAEIVDSTFGVKEFQRLFQVFKSNNRANDSYQPRTYPDRVQLFIASNNPASVADEQTSSWSELADVETHVIPGNHYTILQNPNVEKLAEALTACLREAETAFDAVELISV
jgi:amino acid adenylation domain-containing protein